MKMPRNATITTFGCKTNQSYDDLEIGEGGAAMEAWHRMGAAESREELEGIRKALREYCTLDTLAMVKILRKLIKIENFYSKVQDQ